MSRSALSRWGSRLCLLALLVCSRPAFAQSLPARRVLNTFTIVDLLAMARVKVSPDALLDALASYADEALPLMVKIDSNFARVREQSKTPSGGFLGLVDTKRALDAEREAQKDFEALLNHLIERLKNSVSPEQFPRLDEVKQLLHIELIRQRNPQSAQIADIKDVIQLGSELQFTTGSKNADQYADARRAEDTSAARDTVWQARLANVEGRTRALEAHADTMEECRLEAAREAEALGLIGSTPSAVWSSRGAGGPDVSPEQRQRIQALCLFGMGYQSEFCSGISSARGAVLREEVKALDSVESKLTPAQCNSAYEQLLPNGRSFSRIQMGLPVNVRFDGPRDLVKYLLRAKGLTDAQRVAVRTLGRAQILQYRQIARAEAERKIQGAPADADSQVEWMRDVDNIRELCKAAGLTLADPAPGEAFKFPTVELSGSLSVPDSVEFGWWVSDDEPSQEHTRSLARYRDLPAPYADNFQDDLCARLSVPSERRAVVALLVSDARECWKSQVEPLLTELDAGQIPHEVLSTSARNAEVQQILALRMHAFDAAAACDHALYAGLGAALGEAVDLRRIALMEAVCRTADAQDMNRWGGTPLLLDLPRAVLEAPVSEATRTALVKECAPSAEQWATLAKGVLESRLSTRSMNQNTDPGEARADPDGPVARHMAEVLAANDRAISAWKRAAGEQELRLSALVPAQEAEVWQSWIRRLQWPQLYPEWTQLTGAVSKIVERSPDPQALRATIDRAAAAEVAALRRVGDAAFEIASKIDSHSSRTFTSADISAQEDLGQRLVPFFALARVRLTLAAERIHMAVPPECERLLPPSAIARLHPAGDPATPNAEH